LTAPIISLFNHKGGVSKTTTAFNLGWALADRGKRVLIVDADPQCNLTGTVLGFDDRVDFENFYQDNPVANINAALEPVYSGQNRPLQPAEVSPTSNDKLFLLAGHIDLAISETQVAVAMSTSQVIPALRNIPGAFGALVRMTAAQHDIDVVLVDMSPSVGALNQSIFLGSNFFIVPTSPDYYCNQAIASLSRVLPEWDTAGAGFRAAELEYPFPNNPPKFLGIISQRFRPRMGSPARSFQDWIDIIKATVSDELIPSLAAKSMTISEAEFVASGASDGPYNLSNIADFNSLIAQSHKHNVPVFALSDQQIEQGGVILEKMRENREAFKQTFNALAASVERVAGL